MKKLFERLVADMPQWVFAMFAFVLVGYLIFVTIIRPVPTQIMGEYWGGTSVLLSDIRVFIQDFGTGFSDVEQCEAGVSKRLSDEGWHVTVNERAIIGRQRADESGVQRALVIDCVIPSDTGSVAAIVTGVDFDGSLDLGLARIMGPLK